MIKTIAAGAVALTIAGASVALAQQQQTPQRDMPRWQPNAEDAAAFADARIAGLKAGLKLTTEQERHWPALEQALRDAAR